MGTKKVNKKYKRLKIVGIISLVLVLIGLVVPLPLYAESPGEADDLKSYFKIDGKKPKADGKYMITSVYLYKVNGMGAIISALIQTTTYMSRHDAIAGY